MRSLLRSLGLVSSLFLAATLLSAPYENVSALASPSPFPMPFRNADYDSHLASLPHSIRRTALERSRLHGGAKSASSDHHLSEPEGANYVNDEHSNTSSRAVRRQMETYVQRLARHRDNAATNSGDLQSMAAQSASRNAANPAFQQNAAERLSSFKSNMQEADNLFTELAADKGLANYDRNDELETILKDLVNVNKDTLSAIYVMIKNDPTLGPILGPTVYELKCIIDDILDAVENITDGVWNALKPLGNVSNALNPILFGLGL